jgi:hypothetical protein
LVSRNPQEPLDEETEMDTMWYSDDTALAAVAHANGEAGAYGLTELPDAEAEAILADLQARSELVTGGDGKLWWMGRT